MQRIKKKMAACALVAMLGITSISYPVDAQETDQPTGTEELQELDETAAPIDDTGTTRDEEFTDGSSISESGTSNDPLENKAEPVTDDITYNAESSLEKNELSDGTVQETEINEETQHNIQTYASNNAGDFNVTGGIAGTDWTYKNYVLTIKSNGDYTIAQNTSDTSTTDSIKVEDNFSGSITIKNLNIDGEYGIEANSPSNLTLYLDGMNTIKASKSSAIHYSGKESSRLEITSQTNGTLEAETTSTSEGVIDADIGGTWANSLYNLYISGGNIITPNRIGSGNHLDSQRLHSIYITGGNVKTGRIGGGRSRFGNGTGGTVYISGGTVTVGGINGSGTQMVENIIVTGGSVKCSNFDVDPTDENGNPVYLLKLDNLSGVNEITVDSTKYTRNGDHQDDGAFYLYLTGQDHRITTPTGTYQAVWNGMNGFTIKQSSPIPTVTIDTKTASSITVTELDDKDKYGGAEYSKNGTDWQDSNVFENLPANKSYTIYARYKGNNSYMQSESGTISVSTNAASYTITIPKTTLTAGKSDSKATISVNQQNFDLGAKGKVEVKVQSNSSMSGDGKLTLTRENDSAVITSALLVNDSAFTDISKAIVVFDMGNYNAESRTISFAQPEEQNILAGTYKGTVIFVISYSE